MPHEPPRLVIFDLDGTLVDSRLDIAVSINAGLKAVGAKARDREEIFPLIGQPLSQMYQFLLPPHLKDREGDAGVAYRANYYEHCAVHSTVFPGVFECLGQLRGADIGMAVATTKMTFQAVRVVEQMGLVSFFELVHGCDGIPHKPDPTVILQVLEKLQVSPAECWMVGDTSMDILAGQAAGMRTCAVTYGNGTAEQLARCGPGLTVDDLREFAGHLLD